MRVELIRAEQLTPALVRQWERLQRSQVRFHSPFLRPEFTIAVASVRRDVQVAILERDGEIDGFFPFQRSRGNTGRPVGSKMSDLQALIAGSDHDWDPSAIIKACRLKAWHFHQFQASQTPFEPFFSDIEEAVYMDLSRGYEDYARQRNQTGTNKLKQSARFRRQAERLHGPLRFVPHTSDPDVFRQLIEWKSQQYRETRATDVLSFGWTVELLRELIRHPQPEFGGTLSALYFGDRLAAVELRLRSYEVQHTWFPAYNRECAKYSPGSLLAIDIATVAPSLGIERIELGKNNLPYKASFASASYPVARGVVAVGTMAKVAHMVSRRMTRWGQSEHLQVPRRMVGTIVRPIRNWFAFR